MSDRRLCSELEPINGIAITADSLGYYWQDPINGSWYGPINCRLDRLWEEEIAPALTCAEPAAEGLSHE